STVPGKCVILGCTVSYGNPGCSTFQYCPHIPSWCGEGSYFDQDMTCSPNKASAYVSYYCNHNGQIYFKNYLGPSCPETPPPTPTPTPYICPTWKSRAAEPCYIDDQCCSGLYCEVDNLCHQIPIAQLPRQECSDAGYYWNFSSNLCSDTPPP